MSEHFISFAKKYLSHLNAVLDGIDQEDVAQFVDILFKARDTENSVFFIGNGGSAATSAHFANDLAIGTKQLEKPFRVFSLVDNIATTTAIGNDFGYEEIFARQIEVYGKSGDVCGCLCIWKFAESYKGVRGGQEKEYDHGIHHGVRWRQA